MKKNVKLLLIKGTNFQVISELDSKDPENPILIKPLIMVPVDNGKSLTFKYVPMVFGAKDDEICLSKSAIIANSTPEGGLEDQYLQLTSSIKMPPTKKLLV